MYIMIVGGGRVGYYLAKALLKEGHEALIIEEKRAVCEVINEELGSVCLRGDGCEVSTLTDAGANRADMLVSVTGDDEDNLVACQLAKHKFKVSRTIARIKNPRNEELFKKLGIDVTISSTNVILEHITEEVPTHPVTHLMKIRDRGLEIVEVRVPAGSATAGKAVKDLSLPAGSMLSLIIRKAQKPIVPAPATVLMAGDQVIAVTPSESEEALRAALNDG
ncbi:MAG: TrkA family potassium uptake protein [Dehalococcoidales bacterium]|nr:TrkA family potassium uptake protein [Dehalococcoidales bacterium]